MSMPTPAISHATSDPATPVWPANRLGSENTPAPTMEPTTIIVMVVTDSLTVWGAFVVVSTIVTACRISNRSVSGYSTGRLLATIFTRPGGGAIFAHQSSR